MLKIGTLKQLEEVKSQLPLEVCEKVQGIIKILDSEYSADRNIELSDGGFVAVANTPEAMKEIEKIICIDKKVAEWAEPIGTEYVNALFVLNNEYTINLILHKSITPKKLLNEAIESQVSHQE